MHLLGEEVGGEVIEIEVVEGTDGDRMVTWKCFVPRITVNLVFVRLLSTTATLSYFGVSTRAHNALVRAIREWYSF